MKKILSLLILLSTISCNEPAYTVDIPDSHENRECFVRYLKTEPSNDVNDIYCYCDYMGADYKVLISFYCDSSTIQKIVSAKQMQKEKEKSPRLSFGEEFKWWDKKKIESIIPFKEGKEHEYWKCIWYDSSTKRAYYLEFSI